MPKVNRWALLEHIGAPDDSRGIHFDLLLEHGDSCMTWRLQELPSLDGPPVVASALPLHNLEWLHKKKAVLSRGRGRTRQIMAGSFTGDLIPDQSNRIKLFLKNALLTFALDIQNDQCQFRSI